MTMTQPARGSNREISRAVAQSGPGKDWWRNAVIYQVYLRSFKDGNGDGIGDFEGLPERLDHLESLHVDAIWLSPFYLSPQVDFGYDISDFRAIDPTAGTFDDLHELLEACRERNMKLIVDFVPCHTSNAHPWFVESRKSRTNDKADWYIWGDAAADGTPPKNWLSSFGGPAWSWEPRRAQYYYHPFLACQPALNLGNPEVRERICAEMSFWFDLGVDGLRLDAIQCIACDPDLRDNPPVGRNGNPVRLSGGKNNPFAQQEHIFDRDVPLAIEIFKDMRKVADSYDPPRFLLGELADVKSFEVGEKYTCGNDRLHATYDFELVNGPADAGAIRATLQRQADRIREGWVYNVFGNHDTRRLVDNLGGWALAKGHQNEVARLLMALQLCLKGGACIYQGEELGLTNAEIPPDKMVDPWGINLYPDFEGRDGCRTPLPWKPKARNAGFTTGTPWLPIPPDHAERAVERQASDRNSVLNAYRGFLKWRRGQDLLIAGDMRIIDCPAPLIAFERFNERESMMIVLNFSADYRFWPHEGDARQLFPPGFEAKQVRHGIRLPGFGAYFAIGEPTPGDPPLGRARGRGAAARAGDKPGAG